MSLGLADLNDDVLRLIIDRVVALPKNRDTAIACNRCAKRRNWLQRPIDSKSQNGVSVLHDSESE